MIKRILIIMLSLFLLAMISVVGMAQNDFGNYEGVTVRIGAGAFSTKSIIDAAEKWEKLTGGKIEMTEVPYGDIYEKMLSSFMMGVDAWDIVYYCSNWTLEFAEGEYIQNLEKYFANKTDTWDVLPMFQKLQYYEGERYTLMIDGDVIIGYYRKDALENPEYQAKFASEYGYPMPVPPKTWDQWLDVAKFFNGWDWDNDGELEYGTLNVYQPKNCFWGFYFALAAPFAAHPDYPGYFYFDPNTMEPLIDTEPWVKALEIYIALKDFGPPGVMNYGCGEVRGNYPAGNAALTMDWGDVGIMAQDPEKSTIKGKIGYALTPGSYEVWNPIEKKWDKYSEIQYAPHLAWGGWCAAIPSTSNVADAAWSFMNFMDTIENSMVGVTTPGAARNPYRASHLVNPDAWVNGTISYEDPIPYLQVNLLGYVHPNAQPDMMIPKAGEYTAALDRWCMRAIAGEISAEEALKEAAKEWEKITDNYGRETQKRLYRQIYGLK
ncbi:ABC transporter substrate-binding protein [Atribacter laminatus]|uniref:Extracellular solute-binding protein n=1 Tax=Atribacter laminatus TaxID=2847778 RepID=A0A7T1AL06_ATRLM|nr:extracellular solute-binding protein [Atribacter laminatus]QPM67869.1 hypothetical protein RT761_01082 [Atribacter laminatus]